MQYIYGYNELETAPDNPTSARVQPRRILSGDTFETAKSSTIGAVLFGEHVAVALVMQAAGSGAKAHTHPNKRFTLVAEGEVQAHVAGHVHRVPERFVIHLPPRTSHGISAGSKGARIVTVQDTRFEFAG